MHASGIVGPRKLGRPDAGAYGGHGLLVSHSQTFGVRGADRNDSGCMSFLEFAIIFHAATELHSFNQSFSKMSYRKSQILFLIPTGRVPTLNVNAPLHIMTD